MCLMILYLGVQVTRNDDQCLGGERERESRGCKLQTAQKNGRGLWLEKGGIWNNLIVCALRMLGGGHLFGLACLFYGPETDTVWETGRIPPHLRALQSTSRGWEPSLERLAVQTVSSGGSWDYVRAGRWCTDNKTLQKTKLDRNVVRRERKANWEYTCWPTPGTLFRLEHVQSTLRVEGGDWGILSSSCPSLMSKCSWLSKPQGAISPCCLSEDILESRDCTSLVRLSLFHYP